MQAMQGMVAPVSVRREKEHSASPVPMRGREPAVTLMLASSPFV